MKKTKNVLWISLLGLAMMVTGCRKGLEEDAQYYHSKVLDVTVLHEEWQFDKELGQFYCHKNVEELTEKVYDYGSWELYKEFQGGTKNAYQVALPTSTFLVDTLADKSVFYYTEYLDYRVGLGYVEIQLTWSDYNYLVDKAGRYIKPNEMDFRLHIEY